MKCDKLKSLWVYCRDINEDEDEDFIEFAKKNGYEELVAKSDADKVIADLEESHKMEVEQLLIEIVKLKADYKDACDRLQTANLIKDEQLAAARHHKYKRCLAMARLCKDNADWWNYEQINRLHEQRGNAESFRFKEAHNRFCFFAKWNERWLELAEKFKEEKETLELVENANTLCKEIK